MWELFEKVGDEICRRMWALSRSSRLGDCWEPPPPQCWELVGTPNLFGLPCWELNGILRLGARHDLSLTDPHESNWVDAR